MKVNSRPQCWNKAVAMLRTSLSSLSRYCSASANQSCCRGIERRIKRVAVDQAALKLAPATEQAGVQGRRVTAKSLRVGGLSEVLNAENVAFQCSLVQLDLAPFDALIWPHPGPCSACRGRRLSLNPFLLLRGLVAHGGNSSFSRPGRALCVIAWDAVTTTHVQQSTFYMTTYDSLEESARSEALRGRRLSV